MSDVEAKRPLRAPVAETEKVQVRSLNFYYGQAHALKDGGQQQRLCIARTVAISPEVILLDEPASALDPISTAKVEELIDELTGDYTIAIVTHNMQQAARVSQYTAFMYLGEMVEFAETDKLFTSPRDKRAQDYITGRFG